MSEGAGSPWKRNLHDFVREVLDHEALPATEDLLSETRQAVYEAIGAMPAPQRLVIVGLLSQPGRGAWLARTQVPGPQEVGRALGGLVLFHACAALADSGGT